MLVAQQHVFSAIFLDQVEGPVCFHVTVESNGVVYGWPSVLNVYAPTAVVSFIMPSAAEEYVTVSPVK